LRVPASRRIYLYRANCYTPHFLAAAYSKLKVTASPK
jgi:hypothetical protein